MNLAKALEGEPVAVRVKGSPLARGYLHKSKIHTNLYILESVRLGITLSLRKEELSEYIVGMWTEPIEFKHWDIFDEEVIAIQHAEPNAWKFMTASGEHYGFDTTFLAYDFFPDCPVGTIIERKPQNE